MALRKDDPVFYKVSLTKLLMQAKTNGLIILLDDNIISFRSEIKGLPLATEQASVDLGKIKAKKIKKVCQACGGSGNYAATKCGWCKGTGYEEDA